MPAQSQPSPRPFDERLLQVGEHELLRPVYTLPLHEAKLAEALEKLGIPHYLPVKKAWSVFHRRYKDKEYRYTREYFRPLFPSYLFVKVTEAERYAVLSHPSAIRILPVSNTNAFIADLKLVRQLEQIAQHQELEFHSTLKEGDRFLIECGPWQGVYGWLRKRDNRFLWQVEIQCLNGVVQAYLDPSQYKMTRVES